MLQRGDKPSDVVRELDARLVMDMSIDDLAGDLYARYCERVGGKAFNGDPLPTWDEFRNDPNKRVQANAWVAVAARAIAVLSSGTIAAGKPRIST